MNQTPKSLRLQIGILGRANVGKSSFLNLIAGQNVSITSEVAGTTTDIVEKTMELLPIGPVVFLDTGGLDDKSVLAEKRVERTKKSFERSDVAILVTEPNVLGETETAVINEAKTKNLPLIIVVNKIDAEKPSAEFIETIKNITNNILFCSSIKLDTRDEVLNEFKNILLTVCPEDFLRPPTLIGDLLPAGGLAVLIIPIDLEAPKGRLILPQVQTIRDALDNDAAVAVVKEREYAAFLARLKSPPDIVVCDSQMVLKMVANTPKKIKCTTFSILFSRLKGDLVEMAKGAAEIDALKDGDKVLIAEACSHHALEDDIGRVKIPRWLRQCVGSNIVIEHCSGRDFPSDLEDYKLVIHCGSCMLTRRETLGRIEKTKQKKIAITNYGMAIAWTQGVLKRTLEPFPNAWNAVEETLKNARNYVNINRED